MGEACAPDVKAGDLALLLARARMTGHAVAGVALDWFKCYDRLPLGVFRQVALAAGLPWRIWAPVLHAYALPRCVRADRMANSPEVPTHGLTPGCLEVTDWLAMLALCWKALVGPQQ